MIITTYRTNCSLKSVSFIRLWVLQTSSWKLPAGQEVKRKIEHRFVMAKGETWPC